MILAEYRKQPSEVSDYDISFDAWLRADETIATATAAVEPLSDTAPSSLLVGAVTVADPAVRVRLSGGDNGKRYKCTVKTTTTAGRVDESEFVIEVRDV